MPPPVSFDVVAIGCSAGGLEALAEVLGSLPPDFPAPVVVVQHLHPDKKSHMAPVVGRLTKLQVLDAISQESLQPGRIYFAPPNQHLQLRDGRVLLSGSEPVRHLRPSVDVLFQSVAGEYGSRAIAVVLSGSLSDGAEGIRAVKKAGGATIAELPEDAGFASMPRAAIATGCVDHVVPLVEIGPLLCRLCMGTAALP